MNGEQPMRNAAHQTRSTLIAVGSWLTCAVLCAAVHATSLADNPPPPPPPPPPPQPCWNCPQPPVLSFPREAPILHAPLHGVPAPPHYVTPRHHSADESNGGHHQEAATPSPGEPARDKNVQRVAVALIGISVGAIVLIVAILWSWRKRESK
jgi:hypothetical protein